MPSWPLLQQHVAQVGREPAEDTNRQGHEWASCASPYRGVQICETLAGKLCSTYPDMRSSRSATRRPHWPTIDAYPRGPRSAPDTQDFDLSGRRGPTLAGTAGAPAITRVCQGGLRDPGVSTAGAPLPPQGPTRRGAGRACPPCDGTHACGGVAWTRTLGSSGLKVPDSHRNVATRVHTKRVAPFLPISLKRTALHCSSSRPTDSAPCLLPPRLLPPRQLARLHGVRGVCSCCTLVPF